MERWSIHCVTGQEITLVDRAEPDCYLVINLRIRGWRAIAEPKPLAPATATPFGHPGAFAAMGQQARDQYHTITARVADGHLHVSGTNQPPLTIKLPE